MNAATEPVIDSRASFVAALRWGFDTAVAQGARRILCCDPHFADWPLDDPTLLSSLTTWLKLPQRRLVLLAARYDELPRRAPRFTAWRADWAHAIEAWQPPADVAATVPALLLADTLLSVHLIDAQHWRGRASLEARRARQWCDETDALLQRCEPGFAISTLGL
jgi:hypothetical protein